MIVTCPLANGSRESIDVVIYATGFKILFPSPSTNGIRYVASPRHLLEVEHCRYWRLVTRWIDRLG